MKWIKPTKITPEAKKELQDYSEIIQQLLFNRGIKEQEEAERFLNPELGDLSDPDKFYQMEKAVERINTAIEKKERIFIHGDFDVDGITATAILWGYLFRERGAKVLPYIPSRVDEGYGMTEKSISAIKKKGADLIITVDCGIRDVELVKKYRKTSRNPDGVDFIITDHHKPGDRIPGYIPVVHPDHPKGHYPFKNLSGAAVAWKLVAALEKDRDPERFAWENVDGIDLVAFSTVCDLMPLNGENRILVKYGIQKIRKNKAPWISAMSDEAKINQANLETYHFGYVLGPRINAAGRIGDPIDALRLLTTKKDRVAAALANKLGKLNSERQTLTDEILNDARAMIEQDGTGNHLHFAYGNDWPEGIVGLVAGKIQDEYNRPTIVVTINGKEARGSARSINGFNIIEIIEEQKDLLLRYGGHAEAAGFSLKPENVEEFKERLQKIARETLTKEQLIKEKPVDVIVDPGELKWDVLEEITKLAPFGYKNRRPVFWVKDAVLVELRCVGGDKHLKLTVKGDVGEYLSCIYFGGGEWIKKLAIGDAVELLGYLESNEWNGEENLQLRVVDLKSA